MELWVAIGTLIVVIILLLLFIYFLNKQFSAKEKDLLDRIMARNYEVYVNGEVVKEAAKNPAKIYEDQQEKGIPI